MEKAISKGQASRERIVDIALNIFMQHGYNGTSLQDICRETGLSKGALYHHFAGKDDLYYCCLQHFFSGTARKAAGSWHSRPAESLKQRLQYGFVDIDANKRFVQQRVGRQQDDAILLFYGFLYEATRAYPEFQKIIDKGDDRKLQLLSDEFARGQASGEIRDDIDPFLLAMELEALLQQLVYLRFVNHRIKNNNHLLNDLFQSYWKRLLPAAPRPARDGVK